MRAGLRAATTAACLPTLLALGVCQARAARGQSLNATVGLTMLYDDNILQYSQEQLEVYESGRQPDRFSLATSDDALFGPSLSLSWEADRGGGRRRGLSLQGSGDFHAKNGTADFRSGRVSWREQLRSGQRLLVSYYLLPHFYVRQLFDEDAVVPYSGLSRYRRAQFDLQIASLSWMQPLARRLRVELDYQYENRRYNSSFRERDSGAHEGRVGLHWRLLPRGQRIDTWGGYRVSHARADDGDLEPASADDVDLRYRGLVAGVQGTVDLARGPRWRLSADLEYGLATRTYGSDRPADRYHFGRDDLLNEGAIGFRLARGPHWSVRGFYRLEKSRADLGATAPPQSETGTYRQNQVGVGIEWSGTLWRQAPPEEEQEEP